MNAQFFGLTQLGVQEPLRSNLRDNVDLNWFDDEEFSAAFKSVAGTGTVDQAGLDRVLEEVFRGPAPAKEGAQFSAILESEGGSLSYDALMAALPALKAESAAGVAVGREFTSSEELRTNLKKHTRMARDPKQKFAVPLTAAQEVGWSDDIKDLNAIRRPKMSCPETQYADIMVKSGVYF